MAFLASAIVAPSPTPVASAAGQEPLLVSDLPNSDAATFTVVGDIVFFVVSHPANGWGLWTSDGTTAGTTLVKDSPGPNYSEPRALTEMGGTLFFTVFDFTDPFSWELWKSDGTTAGTTLVKDISPGIGHKFGLWDDSWMTDVDGTLFFNASDATHGTELWKSDGTTAGTTLVKDVRPGTASSDLAGGIAVGDTLFFVANDGAHSREVWKSDGTTAGTTLVKDINPGNFTTPQDPSRLTEVGGILFFVAFDPTHRIELWKSDGTAAGTRLVKDINPGTPSSTPFGLTDAGGTLLFSAADGVHGWELWKSDGTAVGTTQVKDIAPGALSSSPSQLKHLGGTLFFSADDKANGRELWKSDGTSAGTALVKDVHSGAPSSFPSDLTRVGRTVFFRVFDSIDGGGLWKSDGTAAGTTRVEIGRPGIDALDPFELAQAGGTLFLMASLVPDQFELWALQPPPTFASTNPVSPSMSSTPSLIGTAPSGTTVNVYTSATCTGVAAATGPAATFSSTGLGVTVADGSTTTFHASVTDTDGNVSACSTGASGSVTFTNGPERMSSLTPNRVYESRNGPDDATFDGQFQATGRRTGGTVTEFTITDRAGVPADASAVFLNVVAVLPSGPGFLTVFPCGIATPLAANVNYVGGDIAANAVLTKIGIDGKVCVYSTEATDLVIDINGYAPAGGPPTPLTPSRVYESRNGPDDTTFDGQFQATGRRSAGSVTEFTITDRAGVPADASAVFLNVVAVSPTGPGFLTVFPCGIDTPFAANVNYVGGDIAANAVLTKIGIDGKVCVHSSEATDLVIDINGYAPAGGPPSPITPSRVYESRSGPGETTFDGQFQATGRRVGGFVTEFTITDRAGVPADSSAVFLNVVAVLPTGPGFLTVFPCGIDTPLAANVNYVGGDIAANAVLTKIGNSGTVCVYSSEATDLVIDINGYIQS